MVSSSFGLAEKQSEQVPSVESLGQPVSKHEEADRAMLIRMGKQPSLKRTFGLLPSLGFSCTLLITWEGVSTLFVTGLDNGGSAGLVYGYILIWLGNLSLFITLAELVSMAPLSSGQYHWVSMLAPLRCHKILSYLTGWFSMIGWQALAASGAYLSGTQIQGLVVLTNTTYNPKPWHGVFLFWAVVVFSVSINILVSSVLPKFEGVILVLHLAGFLAILLPLVILGPHTSGHDVFTQFTNAGGWPTQGLSFFVGLLGNVFAFFGADGAIHMAEEIRNAPRMVPRTMLAAIVLNGALGFGMLLGLLFCLGDVNAALETSTGYPFMEIYQQAVGSTAGAAAMAAFITTMSICATVASFASASRLLWAFARDRALPGWRYLERVNQRTSIPVIPVLMTTTVSVLLALILLGSSTVFNDIVGLTVSGVYSSYLIVASLLLWRRCRGDIKSSAGNGMSLVNLPGKPLIWGPWRMPGVLGIVNNIICCCYLLLIWFFTFWPPATPVDASTMNYNVLLLGATTLFSLVYYVLYARKVYSGPSISTSLSEAAENSAGGLLRA